MKIFLIALALVLFAGSAGASMFEITCPASGTSIEIMPARPGTRINYGITNGNTTDVWIAQIADGTASLSGSNAKKLMAGYSQSDDKPNVHQGRFVCMSTTATPMVIEVEENTRP